MEPEKAAMDLILHAGNARSLAMEAIAKAKAGEFDESIVKLRESEEEIELAHLRQTDILERYFDKSGPGISMLVVHAQDHVMNAVTILDMAREFFDLYRVLHDPRDS
jgi:PTS system cellobiose-specific IIA component